MEAHLFGRLTSAEAARRRLLAAVRPIARVESIGVAEAGGRVAARPVRAARSVPPFDRAGWDGYAVRSRDAREATARTPVGLRVVGEVFAERPFPGRVGAGEAVAIATGGAIPAGADAVEIFENVRREGGRVRLDRPVRRGARIALAGDDFPKGTGLVRRGELLGPAAVGAIAACGIDRVEVYARPIVAIVPNGNELRAPGARLRDGEIFESNNAALSAFVAASGGVPRPRAPVPDDPRRLERALREALRTSDLVLATGGSSVGERDHLPRIFPRLGELLFHGVAVRPGKPTLAARCRTTLLLGLPGHPTSCLMNMQWMVLPVLRKLARLPGPGWTERTVRLRGAAMAPTPGFATVVPLRVEGDNATPTFRGSSAVTSLRGATAFAMLPPGRTRARAGARLRACVLDPPLGTPASG